MASITRDFRELPDVSGGTIKWSDRVEGLDRRTVLEYIGASDIFALLLRSQETLSQGLESEVRFFEDELTWNPAISARNPVIRIVSGRTTESPALALAMREIFQLQEKVLALEDRISTLVVTGTLDERIIVLRTISKEEARAEILQLFQSGDVIDYGDIAEKLRIDLRTVVEICNDLEREGVIGESH